jgi:hypothetical protein
MAKLFSIKQNVKSDQTSSVKIYFKYNVFPYVSYYIVHTAKSHSGGGRVI